jgi:hypothetical protein
VRNQNVSDEITVQIVKVTNYVSDAFLFGGIEYHPKIPVKEIPIDDRNFLVWMEIANSHSEVSG